jgi:hypothetical protein
MNRLAVPIRRAARSFVLVVGGSQCGSSGFTPTPILSFGTIPSRWLSRSCSYSSTVSNGNSGDDNRDAGSNGIDTTTTTSTTSDVYLHVGPSGDCWTGHSIFAAKHLQPDYVKSVQLPTDTDIDILLERLEGEDALLAKSIYDSGIIPVELLQQSSKQAKNDNINDLTSPNPNPRLKR